MMIRPIRLIGFLTSKSTYKIYSTMADVTGKFQLIDSDEENMDKILAAIGASAELRQMNKSIKPIVEFSRDGDEYIVRGTAPGVVGKEYVHKFHLDEEFEETTFDGRKVKSMYKRVGDNLVHTEVSNGKTVTYEREAKGDNIFVTITCDDMVAKRMYKRL